MESPFSDVRNGRPSTDLMAEAERHLRHTPFCAITCARSLRRLSLKPTRMPWVGCARRTRFALQPVNVALQHRVRHALATIGAKVPRTSAGTVPPHLARLGITARETEILRLVNTGLSNHDIADRLFISVRTVESHVSSMLQKAGQNSREQLPLANVSDT